MGTETVTLNEFVNRNRELISMIQEELGIKGQNGKRVSEELRDLRSGVAELKTFVGTRMAKKRELQDELIELEKSRQIYDRDIRTLKIQIDLLQQEEIQGKNLGAGDAECVRV